jgi:hypothetical protein
VRTSNLEAAAASTVDEGLTACRMLDGLMMGRLAGCFARVEPQRQARKYVIGLVSELPGKNCWTLAEQVGDQTPDKMQRLLERAACDAADAMAAEREFALTIWVTPLMHDQVTKYGCPASRFRGGAGGFPWPPGGEAPVSSICGRYVTDIQRHEVYEANGVDNLQVGPCARDPPDRLDDALHVGLCGEHLEPQPRVEFDCGVDLGTTPCAASRCTRLLRTRRPRLRWPGRGCHGYRRRPRDRQGS